MDDTLRFCPLADCGLAFRTVGSGPPLLLVHGYPLSGRTWRRLLPALRRHFTCLVPDLAGAGDTRWRADTDFGFRAQAQRLRDWLDALGVETCAVLAHDTGATIARQLALIDPARVSHLVLIGTEIPGHRPDWIQFFQAISTPRFTAPFRWLLGQRWFLTSHAAFGGVFHDPRLIFGDFHDEFVRPLREDTPEARRRLRGLVHYLKGIDWPLVDSFRTAHARITAPTLLVWGDEDPVFPVDQARGMAGQFGNCQGFVVVPRARTFLHEEYPETVVGLVEDFVLRKQGFPLA